MHLAYPEATFKRAPAFDKFYNKIKALVENEEYYVVGHSIGDDVTYLNNIFANVFGEIQKKLKKNNGLTFSYRLVGSANRHLVIRHHKIRPSGIYVFIIMSFSSVFL